MRRSTRKFVRISYSFFELAASDQIFAKLEEKVSVNKRTSI